MGERSEAVRALGDAIDDGLFLGFPAGTVKRSEPYVSVDVGPTDGGGLGVSVQVTYRFEFRPGGWPDDTGTSPEGGRAETWRDRGSQL
jgi:hypothetical protein